MANAPTFFSPSQTRGEELPWLVTGGGIGGLAAALGLARIGRPVHVLERAVRLSEVGAGIQLGPNAVAVLQHWGLWNAYRRVACLPAALHARSAGSATAIGRMDLAAFAMRYGYPYTTVHRADLQSLLLQAVKPLAPVHTACEVYGFDQDKEELLVHAHSADSALRSMPAQALIGADGLWSRVRHLLLGDGKPEFTGDVAYRALLPMSGLPAHLRSTDVTVWMGRDLHVVCYPVRGGEALNVVCVIAGRINTEEQSWDLQGPPDQLARVTRHVAPALMELLEYAHGLHGWQMWALHVRPPMQARQYVSDRVALLGDAAHPMRPYLAQGAAMALEDARQLALSVQSQPDPRAALQHYARARWQRNARVQQQSWRNGRVFHASGLMRAGRDLGLMIMGPRLMDAPWLYGYRPG